MTREDEIRARLEVLPWASWATVDKDDLRYLLAEVEGLRDANAAALRLTDKLNADCVLIGARFDAEHAKVARVEAAIAPWPKSAVYPYKLHHDIIRAALDGDQ